SRSLQLLRQRTSASVLQNTSSRSRATTFANKRMHSELPKRNLAAEARANLMSSRRYRALGGGWQIRVDSNFVTAATVEEMRSRPRWGSLLPPPDEPQPPAPGLPSPEDLGSTVRRPQW